MSDKKTSKPSKASVTGNMDFNEILLPIKHLAPEPIEMADELLTIDMSELANLGMTMGSGLEQPFL